MVKKQMIHMTFLYIETLSDEYKNNLLNESIDEYEYKNKVYKLYYNIYEDVYYQDKTEVDLYEGMVKIACLCHSKNKNEIDVINFCSTEGNFNLDIASFLMNSGVPEKDIEFFDETKDCIYIGNIDFFENEKMGLYVP